MLYEVGFCILMKKAKQKRTRNYCAGNRPNFLVGTSFEKEQREYVVSRKNKV